VSGATETAAPLFVVGVDDSDSARHAAEWAAEVAAAWAAPLRLVHAASADLAEDPRWLRELRDAVERTGVENVESRIVARPATDELIDGSRGAGMVVVGSYGEGSRSGMLAGSTALSLVEAAACPVAVVRGSTPGLPPPRRGSVVVGVDPGDVGDRDTALHTAAALAVAFGARLSVLHAWSDVVEQGRGLHRSATSGTELAARAVELVDAHLGPLYEVYPGLGVERHVVDDTALRALLEQASAARAVVVGHRRGNGTVRRLGSTSKGLVAFAPCPVVVTRAGGG